MGCNLCLNKRGVYFQNPKIGIIIAIIKLYMFKFINIYHFCKKIKNYLKNYVLYYNTWYKPGIRKYDESVLTYLI